MTIARAAVGGWGSAWIDTLHRCAVIVQFRHSVEAPGANFAVLGLPRRAFYVGGPFGRSAGTDTTQVKLYSPKAGGFGCCPLLCNSSSSFLSALAPSRFAPRGWKFDIVESAGQRDIPAAEVASRRRLVIEEEKRARRARIGAFIEEDSRDGCASQANSNLVRLSCNLMQ